MRPQLHIAVALRASLTPFITKESLDFLALAIVHGSWNLWIWGERYYILVVMEEVTQENWWKYLNGSLQELMRQSLDLIDREKERLADGNLLPYHDYSFVVFSAAKAYEGFLKQILLDMKLISNQQFLSEHFRIGRALSPNLPVRYRHGWVFGKLTQYCHGDELPLRMWDTWKRARNRIFHYFPNKQDWATLEEAEGLVEEIKKTMKASLEGCQL